MMMATHTPSFSIFKPNSQEKVDTLKACFIDRIQLNRDDLPANIVAKDGIVYSVVYDNLRIPESVRWFDVIISFQQHTYGNFAVVRIAR